MSKKYIHPDDRPTIKQIKERTEHMQVLEKELSECGPARASKIIAKQTEIEEYYYADVIELLETMENVAYQLEAIEPLLEMPDKGYVRNNFNRVLSTLKGG